MGVGHVTLQIGGTSTYTTDDIEYVCGVCVMCVCVRAYVVFVCVCVCVCGV